MLKIFIKKVFRLILNISFSNKPYSIKKTKRFGRNFLLYIDQHTGRKIFLGLFEREETRFLSKIVEKDDVCLDVGANIGYYTNLFAASAGKVVAIEPVRQNADLVRLSSSINRDTHVEVICAAVSDKVDEVEFVESNQSSLSGVSADAESLWLEKNYDAVALYSYTVPSVSIDSLTLKKLDIVKMDIEGYELIALKGMTKTLKELVPRLLMIELVGSHMERFGTSIDEVITLLQNFGYTPNVLLNRELVEYTGQKIPNDNLFFVNESMAN